MTIKSRKQAFVKAMLRFFFQTLINGFLLIIYGFVLLLLIFATSAALPLALELRDSTPGFRTGRERFQPLSSFPEAFKGAVLYLEDAEYYEHWGVNAGSVGRAISHNLREGGVLNGGSSISQQLGRTMLLNTRKNLVRKALELEAALIFEAVLGKDRIFELYLNYIPLGKGIRGFHAAAEHYFQRPLSRLETWQSVALLAIMPSPMLYSPEDYYLHPLLRERSRKAYRWFYGMSPRINP